MTGSDQMGDRHALEIVEEVRSRRNDYDWELYLRAADEIERLVAALVAERALADTLAAAASQTLTLGSDDWERLDAALAAWRVARA